MHRLVHTTAYNVSFNHNLQRNDVTNGAVVEPQKVFNKLLLTD